MNMNSASKYSLKIREEELKNAVARDWFPDHQFDTTKIIGNIDFSAAVLDEGNMSPETQFLLWAEAKAGNSKDLYESFIQLILTVGKARTIDHYLPPHFLGAFDAEKIAFIPFDSIMGVFSQNDFNWNVTPSDHETKEFKQLFSLIHTVLENNSLVFSFAQDSEELTKFIQSNFRNAAVGLTKIPINKNNFTAVYAKWLVKVKPSINADWEKAQNKGILDADFYLADLLSSDNISIKESLFVLLKSNHYEFDRSIDDSGFAAVKNASFKDNQKSHTQFWNLYTRPPKEEFWQYILDRRDLLVPQDIRERKGSFYTPRQWVELSQKYIADVLGEDWQTEYYIWDCCAGTGNLLAGLTEKYRIWASTLDKADVAVMQDLAKNNKNLLESHIFQFDFLNDSFEKLPEDLQEIIRDPEKRKKLVIYINPPYAEASDRKQVCGTGENKTSVANTTLIYEKYQAGIGTAARELFAQFLIRIHQEIRPAYIGQFSTLKHVQASNFLKFREIFKPKLEKLFLVPANTFDNVTGQFPIGFFIWNMQKQADFKKYEAVYYDSKGEAKGEKTVYNYDKDKFVIEWLRKYYDSENPVLAYLRMCGTDMQHNRDIFITGKLSPNDLKKKLFAKITKNNIIETAIYCTIRHIVQETWLNDRDQFLSPNPSWEKDEEFKTNCLCWTLFNNNIQSEHGINHWIPFTEKEAEPKSGFKSHFMTDFIAGKIKQDKTESLLDVKSGIPSSPLQFSEEAKAVFEAGKALYKYYHEQPDSDPNAGLYDIKKYFQGMNDKGRMNPFSDNSRYTELLSKLKTALTALEQKIEPKIYEHGFLK